MKLTDTQKAALILITYAVLAFLILGIADPRYSLIFELLLAFAVFLIFYSSWLIERTERRMKRYMEAADRVLRQAQGKTDI